MSTAMIASPALAEASRWLTGQMPQMRGVMPGISKGPAFAELLEAAELDDVELGVGHLAGVVEVDGDLGVALDAGHGIDDDAFGHE